MRRVCAGVLVAIAVASLAAGQDAEPSLEVVLARAAAYVTSYQAGLAGIVAEEHYRQNVLGTQRRGGTQLREFRDLRSDLLLVKPGSDGGWLQFRDVFEVDRKPIRDRDERLYKLFVGASADRNAQAEAIQTESSRYNIGPIRRTINMPMLALLLFDRGNQPRFTYARAKAGNVKRFAALAAETDVWLIEYRETQGGTVVRGADDKDIPSHGRVWIDGRTGRFLRTELISEDTEVRALIDVSYRAEAGLELLVPSEMRETYELKRTLARIDGRATYGRFRQFTVTTTEKPKG
ncbi:MAG: hypothetical protein WC815_08490 [Vicinamibacterales bacterium]|jgi:hypothetical protein